MSDPATLRKVGAKQSEWTDKRDAAIVQAHRGGMSLRAIADAVGMSHMGVKRIVERGTHGEKRTM